MLEETAHIRSEIKNKPRDDRQSALLQPPTQLFEIILYAAPGVFSDEGLDRTPRLLLVSHIGVDPGSVTQTF